MNKDTRIWLAQHDFAPGQSIVRSSEGYEGAYEYWCKIYIHDNHDVVLRVNDAFLSQAPSAKLVHTAPNGRSEVLVCHASSPLAALVALADRNLAAGMPALPCCLAELITEDLRSAQDQKEKEDC